MKHIIVSVFLMFVLLNTGCSLPPERPVYREELYRTRIFQQFVIKESPESVLAALNRDGEVVIEGFQKEKPYYIRLFATREGLQLKVFER